MQSKIVQIVAAAGLCLCASPALEGGTLTGILYLGETSGIAALMPDGVTAMLESSYTPSAVTVDNNGDVFAADPISGNVYEYTPAGAAITLISGYSGVGGDPDGLAVDASGNLYVADGNANQILEFAGGGTYTVGQAENSFPTGSAPGLMAIDSSGNLFVADVNSDDIVEIPNGGGFDYFAFGLATPGGVATDSAGNVYVSTSDGNVTEYDPNGNVLSTYASGFSGADALAYVNGFGLLVGDSTTGNRYQVASSGATPTIYASGFSGVDSLAMAPEPASWWMAGIGAALLAFGRSWRHRTARGLKAAKGS